MSSGEAVQRVRIYLSERDLVEGQPRYIAVVERLRREGATGATVLRGVAGFGAGHRLRPGGASDVTLAAPIVIEWIDRVERVARILPLIDDLIPDALVTLEELRIHRALLRATGPLARHALSDVLTRPQATALPTTPLPEAIRRLVELRQPILTITDESGRVSASMLADDVARLCGAAPSVLAALDATLRQQILADTAGRALADVASGRRTLYIEAAVPQAVNTLIEWGLDALPVLDRDGRLVGIFGVEQALRAALAGRTPGDSKVRDAEPLPPVGAVMQTLVPTVAAETPLTDALLRLLGVSARPLVVTDGFAPVGTLDAAQLAGWLPSAQQPLWLAALRDGALPQELRDALIGRSARDAAASAPTIDVRQSEDVAAQLLLANEAAALIAVDEGGRLAGLVTQRGLMRALAQEHSGA